MVTKEQAMNCTGFRQIAAYPSTGRHFTGGYMTESFNTNASIPLDKPINWRRNGKTKNFKRACNSHKFSVPIKHGLCSYGYITEENAHLFEVVSP